MAFELPQPRFMPCPDCGGSVARGEFEGHLCDRERWLDYNVFKFRPELDAFDDEVGEYLRSPQGRFELWYAARRRRAA